MMRIFFWTLLLANAVLAFLLMQTPKLSAEKTGRSSASEISPERLTLLSARPLIRQAAEGECIEVGPFTTQSALKFEAALALLPLRELPKKRLIQAPPSHLVFIAPQQGEASAQRRLTQLRGLGFNDSAVIRDAGERRWGVSLGIFTSQELAEARVTLLKNAGVTDVRLEEHPINSSRFAYELRGLDRTLKAGLQAAQSSFEGTSLQPCSVRADATGTVKRQ